MQHIYAIILMPVAVIIGAKYGIAGLAIAVTVVTIFMVLIFQIVTNTLINLNMRAIINEITPAAIGSIILMTGIVIYRSIAIYDIQPIYMFLSSLLIGIIVYVISMRIFYKYIFNEIKTLILEVKG